jgi:hypothetical protein
LKGGAAIALQENSMHKIISALQQQAGLHKPEVLKSQSALDNIRQNAELTRQGMIDDLVNNRGWERANAEDFATKKVSILQAEAEKFVRDNIGCK